MEYLRSKEFIIKEDGTIVRSETSSSRIEIFKKKISHNNEEMDSVDSENVDAPICPECLSDDVTDDGSGYLQYVCNECSHNWGNRNDVECPECRSQDVMDDGSEVYQFECENCGHIWGNYDDYDDEITLCPECGSDNIIDDGSDYLQYECDDCGHIWGDEEN